MSSTIDATKPVASSALASSVLRANFQAAVTDINALQTSVGALQASAPQTMTTTSDVAFRDLTTRKLIGSGTAPAAVAGTGAGTSPTIVVQGHDTGFQVSVTAGTAPAVVGATIFTLTFTVAYSTAPIVVFSAGNQAAQVVQSTSAGSSTLGTVTTTGFTFLSGVTTGLTAAGVYLYNFTVIGK